MKISREKAIEVYEDVRKNGEEKRKRDKVTRRIEEEKYIADGWEYTFYFCEGTIVKIEERNPEGNGSAEHAGTGRIRNGMRFLHYTNPGDICSTLAEIIRETGTDIRKNS